MSIPNFSELLAAVMQGDFDSLSQWFEYTKHKAFNRDEIGIAIMEISKLKTDTNKQNYHLYTYLTTLWKQHKLIASNHSLEQLIRYYEGAVANNNSFAMHSLALIYLSGRDGVKAIQLLQRAANLDNPLALCELASRYKFGEGVKKSATEAFALYKRAAKLNSTLAMRNLVTMYKYGIGTTKSEAKANKICKQIDKINQERAVKKESPDSSCRV